MTTSLKTNFLSGGFSIQRNDMISIMQQRRKQTFQFMNSFNQTFTRIDAPAQAEFDRIDAYSLTSSKRVIIGGASTKVSQPAKMIYRNGDHKAVLSQITLDGTKISSIIIADGGSGYAPNAKYNINLRGGGALMSVDGTLNDSRPAVVKAYTDGIGRLSSLIIEDAGTGYSDDVVGHPLTATVDESPDLGQYVVSFFRDRADQSSTGVGAITSIDFVSGHDGFTQRTGVWFAEQNTANPVTTSGSGDLTRFKMQVYCDSAGTVSKVSVFEFGEGFTAGDTITIPQALLGNESTGADLTISVGTVTTANQVEFDYGTVTWRSESFTPGDMIDFEYYEDTNVNTDISNGMFRQLAEDMCLHPYANYYSSDWSKNSQRNATLNFNVSGSLEASSVAPGTVLTATLKNKLTGDQLSATEAFQPSDIGKRIIEPYGDGTCVIESVDASGVATLSMLTTNYSNQEVNSWTRLSRKEYDAPYWRLAIRKNPWTHTFDATAAYSSNNVYGAVEGAGGFESQPYNIIYPFIDVNSNAAIDIGQNGQQNHREVKKCVDRIGDLFVIESEKATDLLSSTNEITAATTPLPTTINLPQPVKDKRKPQKWRLRFFYDQRDEYIYVNAATDLQIKDNGNITKGQGRDGIKQGIFRQPGEMSEIYHNFSNDTNKAKSGFFRRQGKTTKDVESAYPMTYRLSCTDHGTGLFMFDHASVDQDDDYAWFTIQRHVNNISGKMEMEDGKSPVHCLYCPSKRPEEASEFNVGYYASVDTQYDPVTGATMMTSKTLNELEVFDINGRKLQPGLAVESSIKTDSNPVGARDAAYGSGNAYATRYTDKYIPLTDASALGTDPTVGISITNDKFTFPPIGASYESLTKSNITDTPVSVGKYIPAVYGDDGTNTNNIIELEAAYYTTARTGFNLSFGTAQGYPFVPIGQYITGLAANTRNSAKANYGSPGSFVHTGSATGMFNNDRGLENWNSARNQQQGPSQLGLTLHRVRHRSNGGIDTFLDKNKDVKFHDKTEEGPNLDGDSLARNLPLVSSIATFSPFSVAAKTLAKSRRIRIVHFTEMLVTPGSGSGDTATDATIGNLNSAADSSQSSIGFQKLISDEQNTGSGIVNLVPLVTHPSGGTSSGYIVAEMGPTPTSATSFRGYLATQMGSGGDTEIAVGDVLNAPTQDAQSTLRAIRVDGFVDTFPEGDEFIYEYAWLGSGYDGIYANFYGRSGTASRPLFETNRLKVFVDSLEAEAAIIGQNYSFDEVGDIQFGTTNTSLEYFGVEKNMYAYNLTNDTLKFAQVIPNGVIVKLSYEPYADVEENDSGTRTYLVKVPEDRDIPSLWHDVHREAKGIYRFVVRELDVLKPWDYHVSAVIPQIDSPACINPVEQLSITQDKTIVFNFPSPLASQRFIYSDSELDIIAVASANSSTQSGLIKTSSAKFDLDGAHSSDLRLTDSAGVEITKATNSVSAKGSEERLNFRREYFWHNYKKSDATTDAIESIKSTPSRTYMGMASTKPHGNGMRIFFQVRGGSIRPVYSDYTPREIFDVEDNFPASPSLASEAVLGGVKYVYQNTDNDGTGSGGKEPEWVPDFTANFDSI